MIEKTNFIKFAENKKTCSPHISYDQKHSWKSTKIPISMIIIILIISHRPAMAQCVSDPPSTGLGSCMDFMAATSITVTNQIKRLGYELRYGQSNYTDHREKIIYIHSYDCNSSETTGLYARLALLAHELGHAEYGAKKDISSRSAYIQSLCDGEGYAIQNNIRVRAENLECSMNSIDIGIIASNPEELSKINDLYKNDIRILGNAFCKNNFTSTTKQNYIDYYGEHYDQHFQ